MAVLLEANPKDALVDDDASVRLTGVDPGAEVEIMSSLTDGSGRRWSARADYQADDDGIVDVTRASALHGDYSGCRPMGLIEAMRPEPGRYARWPLALDDLDSLTIDFDAVVGGSHVASSRIIRRLRAEVSEIKVDDGDIRGWYVTPRSGPILRHILVLGGSGGGAERSYAGLLASRGFGALALSYFGEPGLPPTLECVPLELFFAALRWLENRPVVPSAPVAVFGVSKGAEAALLVASHDDSVEAVVAFAPSAYVFQGLGENPRQPRSSWTLHGSPLPFLRIPAWPIVRQLIAARVRRLLSRGRSRPSALTLRDAYGRALRNADAVSAAAIPVERMACRTMLVCGEDDAVWPSSRFCADVAARASGSVTVAAYPGVGHDIGFPYLPTAGDRVPLGDLELSLGGNAGAKATARADVWPRVLHFLENVREQG